MHLLSDSYSKEDKSVPSFLSWYKMKMTKESEFRVKQYSCFICDAKSPDKGLPLLLAETTFSRICLGEKLQEILGDKFIVLISGKDSVCWDCAERINWVDTYEQKIDVIKEKILNQVVEKYKSLEMCLQSSVPEEQEEIVNFNDNYDVEPEPEVKAKPLPATESATKKRKRGFTCNICEKKYMSSAALAHHISKQHPPEYPCEECGHVLYSQAKYKAHKRSHTLAATEPAKELSCVLCGFKANNTEVYCRHVCNSAIVSLACITCKKRFVDTKKDGQQNYQCQECTRRQQESNATANTEMSSPEKDTAAATDADLSAVAPEFLKLTEELPTTAEEAAAEDGSDDAITDMLLEVEEEEESVDGRRVNNEHLSKSDHLLKDNQVALKLEKSSVVEDQEAAETSNLIKPASYLKCTTCNEEFELSQLATHQCFTSGEPLEFAEVEHPTLTKQEQYISMPVFLEGQEEEEKYSTQIHDSVTEGAAVISKGSRRRKRRIPKIPAQENAYLDVADGSTTKMNCKTCQAEFKSINLLRRHWDLTGHSREVSTTTIELNKIKDKNNQIEHSFKVVKQNFNIRANVPGQNDDEIKKQNQSYMDCFVRVADSENSGTLLIEKECDTCGMMFTNDDNLKMHQQVECLVCITCGIKFFDNKLLRKHYQYTGHAHKLYKQKLQVIKPKEEVHIHQCTCGKVFQSRFLLGKHLQVHYRGTNKGACHYCLLEFEDKSQIQQHLLEAHGAQLFKCQHCDRTFLSESVRNRHETKHKEFLCKICNIKYKTHRALLLHTEQNHRTMSCRICGKLIADMQSLRRHEKRHFYDKGLQCDLCRKTFRNKTALLLHTKAHAGEIVHPCRICGLGFASQQSLEEHQIVHYKKEYTCRKCNLVCHSRAYFWMHLKLHGSSFVCNICNRTFRDTSLLAVHRRRHFNVRPYQCPHCPRAFSIGETLRKHMCVHTKAFPHMCVLCKKGFLTTYGFHRHLDIVHTRVEQVDNTTKHDRIPSLPLNATDEDLFHAADTLIADDSIMFNEYQTKEITVETVPTSELISNEVVVETTELFEEIIL